MVSVITLNRVVALASREPAVAHALRTYDTAALAEHGLTDEQIAALEAPDTGALLKLGLRPGLCMTVTVLRNPTVIIASGDAAEYFNESRGG